jgi:alkylhydroperoxidase/carboxymuconolactone decarboxylase family protein YurZ
MANANDNSGTPAAFKQFSTRFPQIAERYEALGTAVHEHGPLNDRERALVKLAISGTAGLGSAFKTHIRKGREAGITRAEMEHVALLFLPTIGLPAMIRAMRLIERMYTPIDAGAKP